MHTPDEVTQQALAYAESVQADCTVAIGGGSAVGLGKAIAYRCCPSLKQIAIPTTYAGSEVTPILGETKAGRKVTIRSDIVLPNVIIYDAGLTLSLPFAVSVKSGMNAIAHAVEALYAEQSNPIVDSFAIEGIAAIIKSLPVLRYDLRNTEARSQALYGAYLCGVCLGSVGMALHHKLCHILGGSFNLSHAETHTVILPHAIAYNYKQAAEQLRQIEEALGCQNIAQFLYDFAYEMGAPTSLEELGLKEEDIMEAARLACQMPYPNPAPVTEQGLVQLLRHAYSGDRPAVVDIGLPEQ